MKTLITILFLVCSNVMFAQKANEAIRAGNDFYRTQQYDKAAEKYSEALKLEPTNATAKYNQSAATYRSGKEADALKAYDEIAKLESDNSLRSKAYYNQGAILSKQKKLEESIEAYKNTLRLDPDDKEARENLQKALLELKKKQPPKPKEDQQKKKQEQKQPQPKMSRKEAEQRLKLLEQKEKEVQQRLQKEKSKTGGSAQKDW